MERVFESVQVRTGEAGGGGEGGGAAQNLPFLWVRTL